ncbi:hypothetical protein [Thermospira aquatica]|uniref:Twin-arginine translocation signal domain-containing protein n=1 Tax=Thermospira aquatica TaxID=2828656 RepID=A0AAX3BFG2_9SPIR|nr:hypothetical protein [Thermospira aquatica]URA11014.1 hypothetical protein KDW03_04210 [Thermospira aquatica]
MTHKEYEEALKRGVRKFVVTGSVLCGMMSVLPMYGQSWSVFSERSPVTEPAQSFSHVCHQPSYLQSSSGSVTRALWQAEMEARRSLY